MYALAGVRAERIIEEEGRVVVEAIPTASCGICPACGQASDRVHSRYVRELRDLPACGRPVRVRLALRRFFCRAADCPRRTFAEQVAGATARCRRATVRLEAVLTAFGVALGGEAGARLAARIGVAVGGDTLLRRLGRGSSAPVAAPRVLGVDDWAWRRGDRYGTVLVDLETRRPVDLLPERTAAVLEQWLKAHPGVEVIARDRATEYARGASLGAPDATQVLDRWHLLRNAREVAERLLERRAADLRGLAETGRATVPVRRSATAEARHAEVRQHAAALHAAVRRLADEGVSILGTAKRLGISRVTVRKYRAAVAPERDRPRFPSRLDPDVAYLERRWDEGCRNALQLWREIREQGYPRGSRQVSRWATGRRERDPSAPKPGRPHAVPVPPEAATVPQARRPAVSRLAWLLVRDPDGLGDDDRAMLGQLHAACPTAATAYPLLQTFTRMVKARTPELLEAWLAAAGDCDVPDLVTFAEGLRREGDALRAALTLPWSTGPVEGQITRLKLIKRQGYGRCGLDTLKRRFIHVA
jgi:transposase